MQEIRIPFHHESFPGYFITTKIKRAPAIILIHEIWGLNNNIRDVANRLCEAGYTVLAPDLLKSTPVENALTPELITDMHIPEKKDETQKKIRAALTPTQSPEFGQQMIEKLQTCFSFLLNHPQVNGSIGIIGFCFGGTYSYALAVHQPKLKAAVVFYGQPPQPLDLIETINCPILSFTGEQDTNLMKQLPSIKKKMKEFQKSFQSIVYPNAGHAFFNDTNLRMYYKDAANDAWKKTKQFLSNNLS